ncbi:MAG: HAD family hydrolase [bacterium]
MIQIDIPGFRTLRIENLIMDFNGTIALDGNLLDGVNERLARLSNMLNLFILTADTFGLVEKSCSGLPVKIKKLYPGHEADQKKAVLEDMGNDVTAAIGNGANDVKMLKRACLSIVVLSQEGLCTDALAEADICVPNACMGLDLLLFPKRIVATLRR